MRQRLPNRRQSDSLPFTSGMDGIVRFSRYDDDRLAELFIDIGKPGSSLRAATNAGAVVTSIALQYGVPLEEIIKALPTLDDGSPAEPLGAALAVIQERGKSLSGTSGAPESALASPGASVAESEDGESVGPDHPEIRAGDGNHSLDPAQGQPQTDGGTEK